MNGDSKSGPGRRPLGEEESEDRALGALIRAATEGEEADFQRPDDDAILRYVSGKADEKTRALIQEAMLKSSLFRREIAELSSDMAALASEELCERYDSVEVPPMPERLKQRLLEHRPRDASDRPPQTWLIRAVESGRQILQRPAFAYGLCALLAMGAGFQFLSRQGARVVASADWLVLEVTPQSTESTERRGFDVVDHTWVPGGSVDSLFIDLRLPKSRPPESRYRVTVSGREFESQSVEPIRARDGRLLISVPREVLRPAYYGVLVEELAADGSPVSWTGEARFFVPVRR